MDFEAIKIRKMLTSRGGGIEIDLTTLGYPNEKMTAYQNSLGGGMLGRVASDCTIKDFGTDEKLSEIADKLRRYFHSLTNPEGKWESVDYEKNQTMPVSAY